MHGRGMLWAGEGEAEWGVGGVEGGPDLGSWGKGEGGVCQGHFWHISGPFQSASRCSPPPPLSCLRPGSAAERTAGEEKEATRSTSCRPRDAGCGRPFASGEEVKAVFKKRQLPPLCLLPRTQMCDPSSSKRLHQVLRPAAGVLCVSWASPLRCNECLYAKSCRACLSALSLRSAAVGGLRPWEPTLQPVICRWTAEPLDGGRVHPRVFALLVCVRRFYFSSSSRPSAVTLHLRSRARGSSQVKIPPCETTTLCLRWFERTRPVGTSCSASDAPCCFWARSRETTSNVPAVSSSLFFFFFLRFHVSGVSCIFHLGGSGADEGTSSNVTN